MTGEDDEARPVLPRRLVLHGGQLHAESAADVRALAEELVESGLGALLGGERAEPLVHLPKERLVVREPAFGAVHGESRWYSCAGWDGYEQAMGAAGIEPATSRV